MAVTQVVNYPLMFIESMPSYLKPWVALSPLTYLTDTLKQLMAGAPAVYPLWLSFAVLGVRFWRWG
jgi:hypothetical protein